MSTVHIELNQKELDGVIQATETFLNGVLNGHRRRPLSDTAKNYVVATASAYQKMIKVFHEKKWCRRTDCLDGIEDPPILVAMRELGIQIT